MKDRQKTLKQSSRFEKVFIPDSLAGLSRSHKMIRIEKGKEIQFLKLCSQIRLEDFKKDRAESQRDQRRMKRGSNHTNQYQD
jgi:hypothetical protein